MVLCLINIYDERKGDDDSFFLWDYLFINCRLMFFSGIRIVRVMGLIGVVFGLGCILKWIKIWKGRKKVFIMGGVCNGRFDW